MNDADLASTMPDVKLRRESYVVVELFPVDCGVPLFLPERFTVRCIPRKASLAKLTVGPRHPGRGRILAWYRALQIMTGTCLMCL